MQLQKKAFSHQLLLLIALCAFASPTFADSYHLMRSVYYGDIIIQSVAIALGISLFLGALFRLKKYGESRTMMSQQMTLARPLAMMLAGVCLLCLPVMTKTLIMSIWGSTSPLAYPVMSSPEAQDMIMPVIALVRLVGAIGVVRGFMLISRVGGESAQPGTLGKALLHLLGGIMCIQIMSVYDIMAWIFNFGGV